jgi:hypothetical protein
LNYQLKEEDTLEMKRDICLNNKVTNPAYNWKMDVSLAKIPFKHKTLSFSAEKMYNSLNILTQELE